jgi:hypothetical protein
VSSGQKPGDKKPSASGPLFRKDDYVQPAYRPKEATAEAAPEVSQGAWRERAFVPRGVMTPEAIVAQLDQILVIAAQKLPNESAASQVAKDWLPLLRQAIEQSGGDGLDAWLLRALKPPGRNANVAFFDALVKAFAAVRAASAPQAFLDAGRALIAVVQAALAEKKRVSFKVLERELDGKLEVDELIAVRLATAAELEARQGEIEATMENLSLQARTQKGGQPGGIYSNHARLKAELRVVKAERALRTV